MYSELRNLSEAYYQTIQDILLHGSKANPPISKHSVGSSRYSMEIRNYGLTIMNPVDRILCNEIRNTNLVYPLGNFLWQIFAIDAADFICYYNPKGKAFTDDGKKMYGAYGPRIMPQIADIIRLLTDDPNSRRAAFSFHKKEDILKESRDVPCPVAGQFLIRDGVLHMTIFMRSQNAFGVWPYDIMLFTMLQEYVAMKIQIPIGEYTHICGSVHIYENEISKAEEVLKAKKNDKVMLMPAANITTFNHENMTQIRLIEKAKRTVGKTNALGINDPYWKFFAKHLEWTL